MSRVRRLLNSETRWVKRRSAATASGVHVNDVNHPSAARWCLSGAVAKCYPYGERQAVINKLKDAIFDIYDGEEKVDVVTFNDAPDTDFQKVKAVLAWADV